ncbi:HD domain-containing protein [Bosea sp. (in: a-proteobacteria)]|jgi:predicted hydrolase (HD superfamily)|uniref:HD domain-containing protein n=1 Tax=Bosea sp. (in: a-proteobacteria) TaxID=1871050 RepID=UPI002DDD1D9F|nr:HD domain-containing protein [Bosea sp. (in: a-proteobacteria)]HEV2508077.1 HD domain-containing protein [Bosea sp. (in: a-proteobacteria)]
MLSIAEAEELVAQHLGDAPRANHSRVVAHVMRKLAEALSEPVELWEVVGLCHDLDFFAIQGDWSRHGPMAVEWLGDRIPLEAQQAIAAHDHRTGIVADSRLADSLKAADAITVIDEKLGRPALRAIDTASPYAELRTKLGRRSYLADMAEHYAQKHELPFERLVETIVEAPTQPLPA